MADLNTWKPLVELKKEMDRLWDSFLQASRKKPDDAVAWNPFIDLSETKDEIVVKAEIPGLDPKDIDVSFSNGTLTIMGEKKQEREGEEENYHVLERNYGSFSRTIRLPVEVQSEKIVASCKKGILIVRLPKSEQAKAKEIKIKVKEE